jgi:hypothetical protein
MILFFLVPISLASLLFDDVGIDSDDG